MVSAIAAISTTGLIDYELYTGSVNVRLVQDRLLYGLILRFGRWIKNRSTGIYFSCSLQNLNPEDCEPDMALFNNVMVEDDIAIAILVLMESKGTCGASSDSA